MSGSLDKLSLSREQEVASKKKRKMEKGRTKKGKSMNKGVKTDDRNDKNFTTA